MTEDSKIEDATESTEETKADVEAVKEEAKEEIIVADNDSSSDSEEEPVVSVTEPQVSENVVSEATEEEAVEVPNEPADSEPTPAPVETPAVEDIIPVEEEQTEAPAPVENTTPVVIIKTPDPVPEENSSSNENYIPCEAGSVLGFPAHDTTKIWAITWDTITPTSNKYIYYRTRQENGNTVYDYFIFNETIDTAVMLYQTLNPDVEEQTNKYVQASKQYCPYLVY